MNTILNLAGFMLLGLGSPLAMALESLQATDLTGSGQCPHPPSTAPAPDAGQDAFDRYSWQLFVALNWPAQAGQRGQPDCFRPLGSAGPTVWQSYKAVDEIFLPGAEDPGPWNDPLPNRDLGMINIAALKNRDLVQSIDQAVGGWLIDQRNNPTYYEIAANQVSYDYIVQNEFYNANVLREADSIAFPAQATEIKAAWRVLTSKDDQRRFLTTRAPVERFDAQGRPTGETAEATLGLVGLHIIVKAPGYPQWIWSTFEQIDNVPPKVHGKDGWTDQPEPGLFYAYFSPDAPDSSRNQSPCTWQQQGDNLVCTPKAGTSFQTPDPLSRFTPIASSTAAINTSFQQDLLNSVLRYYQLVTTQRPLMPDNPSNPLGQPTPALAANVTMESYIQPNSSCMNCHSMATPVDSPYKSDFSYLFKFAKAPSTKGKE